MGIGGKKYCNCGHLVTRHYVQSGCTEVVEGSDCEDHWICGCRCVRCIHMNAMIRNQEDQNRREQEKEEEGEREREITKPIRL